MLNVVGSYLFAWHKLFCFERSLWDSSSMVPAGYVHRKDSSVLGHRYTNIMILGSFFFKKSHKQQGSAIKCLPESHV